MTPWLKARCDLICAQIQEQQLWRTRQPVEFVSATHFKTSSGLCLQFASNDYLGLATSQQDLVGFDGAGASPLVSGYTFAHQDFEQDMASYLGFESALYFNSGFAANEAALSILVSKNDVVFGDRLNHASLIDGIQKSGARHYRYQHGSLVDLERLLRTKPIQNDGKRWIVTDAVFSMDGDIAPLEGLVDLAQRYDAALYVDDAHGFGVFGQGRGTLAALGIEPEKIDVLMVTCGKAMGAMGATVLGAHVIVDLLVQKSRSYVYSTAVPPRVLQGCSAALKTLIHADAKREHLNKLCAYLHLQLQKLAAEFGYTCISQSQGMIHPVQPFIIGDEREVLRFQRWLLEQGLFVGAIRPPTVPKGTSRLRLSLNAAHSFDQIDELCLGLKTFCRENKQ